MYYNSLHNWQKPFTVEMYRNINLSCLLLRSQLGRSIAKQLLFITWSFCYCAEQWWIKYLRCGLFLQTHRRYLCMYMCVGHVHTPDGSVHWGYLAQITVATFLRAYPQYGGENKLAEIWIEITSLSPRVFIGWQWRNNRSISMSVDFCRQLVGKTLINVCRCDSA